MASLRNRVAARLHRRAASGNASSPVAIVDSSPASLTIQSTNPSQAAPPAKTANTVTTETGNDAVEASDLAANQQSLPSGPSGLGFDRVLSTGDFHDFEITCGGHTFKTHRLFLTAKSDFFRTMCTGSFKEGVTASADLPDDSPALVARMLTFIYTGAYPTSEISKTSNGTELDQFKTIDDMFSCKDKYWPDRTVLHAHMFGLGDKYGVPELVQHAQDSFVMAFFCKDNPNEVESTTSDPNDVYPQGPSNATIIRAVYNLEATSSRLLRVFVVTNMQVHISDYKALQGEDFLHCLRDIPEFAYDMVTVRPLAYSKCSNCSKESMTASDACECGIFGTCEKVPCQEKWKKSAYCTQCQKQGTLEYPKAK